jgi:hypothetical protein
MMTGMTDAMTDAMIELAELLGPPRPDIVPVPWPQAPAAIGIQLPTDYRRFIDTYGQISINGELAVHGPANKASQPGGATGFAGFVEYTTDEADLVGDDEEALYAVYPAPGGLLAWANTFDCCVVSWLTEGGDPDAWPVIVTYSGLEYEYQRFDGGAVQFLADVCAQRFPEWTELIAEPLGAIDGTTYRFLGDWTGWDRRERPAPHDG